MWISWVELTSWFSSSSTAGPNIIGCLFLQIKFYYNTTTSIFFSNVHGCSLTTMTELDHDQRYWVVGKTLNIYYLDLYRKSLPILFFTLKPQELQKNILSIVRKPQFFTNRRVAMPASQSWTVWDVTVLCPPWHNTSKGYGLDGGPKGCVQALIPNSTEGDHIGNSRCSCNPLRQAF